MHVLGEIADLILSLGRRTSKPTQAVATGKLGAAFLGHLFRGRFDSDAEAAAELYGCSAGDRRYITLKSRTLHTLLDILLLIRPKKRHSGGYAAASHDCNLALATVRVLMLFGKRETAMVQVRRLIHRAQYYHLSDIVLEALVLLRQDAALRGDPTLYERYKRALDKQVLIQEAEVFTSGLVRTMTLHQRSGAPKGERQQSNEAAHYWLKADTMRLMYDTRALHLDYFRLKLLSQQKAREFGKALRTCREQEHYFRRHPHLCTRAMNARLALTRTFCLLALGQVAAALQQAQAARALLRRGEYNWFVCLELLFLLALCGDNYREAIRLYCTALEHREFRRLPRRVLLYWANHEAVLRSVCYKSALARIPAGRSALAPRFGLAAFADATLPDAAGPGDAESRCVRPARILILLKQRKFKALAREVDALALFCAHQADRQDTQRLLPLLQSLRVLIQKNFACKDALKISGTLPGQVKRFTEQHDVYDDVCESILFTKLSEHLALECETIARERNAHTADFVRLNATGRGPDASAASGGLPQRSEACKSGQTAPAKRLHPPGTRLFAEGLRS